jgi:glycosyltransferase involved in cell wall biosynthesis
MLAQLLSGLAVQDTGGLFSYSAVVVDNDRLASARATVVTAHSRYDLPIGYYVEPEQNIALARNTALAHAGGDFIACIDDDEIPVPRWLLELYSALRLFGADGILGPVLPAYQHEPPAWVIKGGFFDRPSHETGQILDWRHTRTGNALLRTALFEKKADWFNPALGSGGEDRDFFRRQIEQGRIFRWCQEAPVFETVRPERWNLAVLVKRALLRGKMACAAAHVKTGNLLPSAVAIALYSMLLPVLLLLSPVVGFHRFVKYLIKNCDHLGKVAAFLHIELVKTNYVH